MFGLTRREQRWKAEQQAAELASCHSKCCRKCGNSSGDWPVPLVVVRLIGAYKGQTERAPTGQHLGED